MFSQHHDRSSCRKWKPLPKPMVGGAVPLERRPHMVEKNDETVEVWGSNTHTGTTQNLVTTCIDYFTFRFSRGYQDNPHAFKKLFEILLVDPNQAEHKPGMNGYETRLMLAPGITLYYGGKWTQTCLGQNTTVLELKGSGCREFEDRRYYDSLDKGKPNRFELIGKIWHDLFEFCLGLDSDGVCTRLDLPVDDFTNDIKIEEIKEKVAKKEYTTNMKKIEEATSHIEKDQYHNPFEYNEDYNNGLNDYISQIDSKNKGYSITFGNRTNCQLCIYDKAAEQHNKDQSLDVKHWIRYESRFYHKNADYHCRLLYYHLDNNGASKYIVSLLKSIFEFKEPNHIKKKNLYKIKTWSKWEKLTQGCEKTDLFSLPIVIKNIDITAAWIMNNVSKAFSKVVLSLPEEVTEKEIFAALLARGISKFESNDLAEVNNYRRQIGLEEFKSVQQLKSYYYTHAELPDFFHPEVVKLLLNKKRRGRATEQKAEELEKTAP